jgi:hypothetical protein
MDELIPVALGGGIGWLCWALPGPKRLVALGVASIVIGIAASYISGELSGGWQESVLCLFVDCAEALMASFGVAWLRARWAQRHKGATA